MKIEKIMMPNKEEMDKKILKSVKSRVKNNKECFNKVIPKTWSFHDFKREETLADAKLGAMKSIEALGKYYIQNDEDDKAIRMFESSFFSYDELKVFCKNVEYLNKLYGKGIKNKEYLEKIDLLEESIVDFKWVISDEFDWSWIKKFIVLIGIAVGIVILFNISWVMSFFIKYLLETIIISLVF